MQELLNTAVPHLYNNSIPMRCIRSSTINTNRQLQLYDRSHRVSQQGEARNQAVPQATLLFSTFYAIYPSARQPSRASAILACRRCQYYQ